LELEYHNLDPGRGLFRALEEEGAVRCLISEAQVEVALREPPQGTRASIRGLCLRRFQVRSLSWGRIVLAHQGRTVELDLKSCVGGLASAPEEIPADATLEDVLKWIAQIERTSRR
jgi:proteasome accessory factor A